MAEELLCEDLLLDAGFFAEFESVPICWASCDDRTELLEVSEAVKVSATIWLALVNATTAVY